MKKQYLKFQDYLVDKLKNAKEAETFFNTAIQEYEEDGDVRAFMLALRYLTEAQGGITKLSEKAHLSRQNLYKVLTGKTAPRLDTALSIISALGMRLSVNVSDEPRV
jgi:probable addiction module antidote protein